MFSELIASPWFNPWSGTDCFSMVQPMVSWRIPGRVCPLPIYGVARWTSSDGGVLA